MRIFKFVKRNIRRTPYQAIAAVMVMYITFLTLFLFLIIAVGSQKLIQYYETRPEAVAFFQDNATEEDAKAIQEALEQTGRTTSVKYISQEEAFRRYTEQNKDAPAVLELVTAKNFPIALEISAKSSSDLTPIAEILSQEPVIEDVYVPEDVIQNLTKATTIVRSVGLIAVSFLIVFSLLVILMIIGFKIRLKRSEIEIMKLLGASTWFIRAPFILEGIFYAGLGTFLAWITSYLTFWYFTPHLGFYLQNIPSTLISLPPPPLFMLTLLLGVMVIAIVIGAVGSYGAVRRYLKI